MTTSTTINPPRPRDAARADAETSRDGGQRRRLAGDFAAGQRSSGHAEPVRGTFATGRRTLVAPVVDGDFAAGLRTGRVLLRGDFATGMAARTGELTSRAALRSPAGTCR